MRWLYYWTKFNFTLFHTKIIQYVCKENDVLETIDENGPFRDVALNEFQMFFFRKSVKVEPRSFPTGSFNWFLHEHRFLSRVTDDAIEEKEKRRMIR